MMDMDFSFENSPWEDFLDTKKTGDRVSVVKLLTMLEREDEETVNDVFDRVDEEQMVLDLSDMPKTFGTGASSVRLRREAELSKTGLKSDSLEENDPLRLYLEEISGQTADDEESLAALCAAGSERAKEKLANIGIQRVVDLSQKFTGYGVLLLDLIQEGSLGLWQAVCSYQDGSYSSLRDLRICNAMARAIALQARSMGISSKMREAMEDYRQVDERLLTDLGRNPTVDEIAEEMHISTEEADVIRKMVEDARLVRRVERSSEADEEQTDEQEQAVEDTAYFQARQRIMELLSVLNEDDAKLLTLRYGLEKGLPMSPEETGKRMGLTAEEVVRREAKALSLLREQK